MQHLTTYHTTGWPSSRPQTPKETPMDPLLAKALVDTSVPVPATRRDRHTPRRVPRVRSRVATAMRRLADRLDAPTRQTAPCT